MRGIRRITCFCWCSAIRRRDESATGDVYSLILLRQLPHLVVIIIVVVSF